MYANQAIINTRPTRNKIPEITQGNLRDSTHFCGILYTPLTGFILLEIQEKVIDLSFRIL
jgi:hypothetical protein